MKAKKIILSSLAVASAGALAAGVYKIAKDQKRLRTQEELVAEVREQMEAMGRIATLYVELFRGIPALLVFFAFGYGIPLAFKIRFVDNLIPVTLSLGMVSAAYISEVLRAGLQAIPKGQMEAARSLGMSHTRAMISIIIPQAFRVVLPPLTNEVILLTKDSSLVYLLGVTVSQYELAKFGREGLTAANAGLTPLVVAGLCYLIITVPLGQLSAYFERRTQLAGRK